VLRIPDNVAPTIVSVSPTNGSTGIDITRVLQVVFSEPLDTNTVNTNTFVLTVVAGGTRVPATVTLNTNGTTVVIDPIASLNVNAAYRLVIGPSVADLAGKCSAFR
jgi:hypothetical protein